MAAGKPEPRPQQRTVSPARAQVFGATVSRASSKSRMCLAELGRLGRCQHADVGQALDAQLTEAVRAPAQDLALGGAAAGGRAPGDHRRQWLAEGAGGHGSGFMRTGGAGPQLAREVRSPAAELPVFQQGAAVPVAGRYLHRPLARPSARRAAARPAASCRGRSIGTAGGPHPSTGSCCPTGRRRGGSRRSPAGKRLRRAAPRTPPRGDRGGRRCPPRARRPRGHPDRGWHRGCGRRRRRVPRRRPRPAPRPPAGRPRTSMRAGSVHHW